jgi:hypothetical protein
MNQPEPMNIETIRTLAEMPGPCITVVLAGGQASHVAIEVKDAINTLQAKLRKRGKEGAAALDRMHQAAREIQGEFGSFAILSSPSFLRVSRVDGSTTTPLVRVDHRFDVRTLLSIIENQKLFHLLALSQKRTRLLRYSDGAVEEVEFPPDVPVSLADSMQTRKPDHDLDNRSTGGPSLGAMRGVTFGTTTDRENKDEYLLHFFSQIDQVVTQLLKGSHTPLIPVGVEHELALYRRVNSYPHLIAEGVHGAADGTETPAIVRRALDLLQSGAQGPADEALANFDKRIGTGYATLHFHEIMPAAWQGRVSHFFFQANAAYTGTFDPVRGRVKQTTDPLESPEDLIESAAWQTILHGGVARILPGNAMPNGVPVCALFRYPAASTVAPAMAS